MFRKNNFNREIVGETRLWFPATWKRIKCFFTKHHFIRFPLLDGTIQIMCTKCPKAFIVKQEINTDDYHDL